MIAQAGDYAYIMPLRDVLHDVRKSYSAWLPSPFEVLVDLAKAEPGWESNDLYTCHSWAFDAVRFLLRKSPDVRDGIIRIITDVLTKSGCDMTSGLTSMWQRETIGSLQDISRITRPPATREVINEVAKLSQACGIEPPSGFLVDLETFMENSFPELSESIYAPQSIPRGDSNIEGADELENSEKQVIVQENQPESEGANASVSTKSEIERGESGEGTSMPEISLLVKAIQRIVQGSSTNIKLKIEDTSEQNSKEETSEDDEEDDENEEPGSGKSS